MLHLSKKALVQIAALVMIVFLSLAFAVFVSAGEPRRVNVGAGLIELRIDKAPVDCDITWESREPLTLDYRVYENGRVFVTYAIEGTIVVSSDVIDWNAKTRDKTTWIVTVGKLPGPQPPVPVPVDPVLPPGIAIDVYRTARDIGSPAEAKAYANNFLAVAAEIGAGAITSTAAAAKRIGELNAVVAPGNARWKALGRKVGDYLNAQSTLSEVKKTFEDVALGLNAAAGA